MADIYGTPNDDVLNGTSENDLIVGLAGSDSIDGGAGNDTIIGDEGSDALIGGAGADFINGGDANDVIYADEQDTHVRGDAGYDVVYIQGSVGVNWILENFNYSGIEELHGTSGNDWFNNYGVADMAIYGEGGDDTLIGNLGNQTLDGGAGSDSLSGNSGDDVLLGGDGDDWLTGDWGNDVLTGGAGVDLINGGDGDDVLNADVNDLYVRGDAGYDKVFIEGNTGVNWYIDGFYKSGIEEVYGSGGADTIVNWEPTAVSLFGRGGDDFLAGNSGNDTLAGGTGNDMLNGGDGDNRYLFNLGDGIDTIQDVPSGVGNRIVFGAGIGQQDLMLTHDQLSQTLTIQVGAGGDAIRLVNFDPNNVAGSMVVSTLFFNDGSQVSLADLLGLGSGSGSTIIGTSGDDFLQGTAGGDVIDGLAGNDILEGLGGDDTITGGAGADLLFGGSGNDVLNADAADSLVMGGDGYDIAYMNDSQGVFWYMDNFGSFSGLEEVHGGTGDDSLSYYGPNEVLLDGGAGQDRLTGGSGNDVLEGGAGNDYLNGQDGNDMLRGGAGDDSFFGDDFFSLTGGHDVLEGSDGQDFLRGAGGNDRLDGGAGTDYMEGGAGNDTYVIDDYSDVVLEGYGAGGIDTIESHLYSYGLFGTEFENLTLMGPNAVYGSGSQFANIIVGNDIANSLAGGDGDDQLSGGAGNDWLSGGQGRDVMYGGIGDDFLVGDDGSIFMGGQDDTMYGDDGNDTLSGENGNDSLYGGAGDDNLTGGEGNDSLYGGTGYDILTGGVGNDFLDGGNGFEGDQLAGGSGNDTYVVDQWYDQVYEVANEGVDTIETALSYIWMGSYPTIENLTFAGVIGNEGYGNELDNVIIGNIGSDMLDGRMGNDMLQGGDGQDQLVGGEGDDILMGEAGVDFLYGADGSDRLDGGAGTDILYGNTGDDTYIVDDQADSVWEFTAEGTDTVESSINYVLGSDLENLTLTGSMAFTGAGNELDNGLTGNNFDNMLDGGAGADTLTGGIGNDQLIGGAGNDTYRFNLGDGIDTIQDFSFPVEGNRILFGAGITQQDLTLTHDSIGQTLTIQVGNGGDAIRLTNFDPNYSRVIATLQFNDGSQVAMAELLGPTQGDDILNGTIGDDVLDGLGGNDVINGMAGNDTLLGSEGSDTLNGGDGDDILDGGVYSDTMAGGAGDDTYIVDQFDEVVTEAVGEGVDTVQSSISGYTLSANVENLTLTGTAMSGIGNDLDTVLVGNEGFNFLSAWGGNDQLNGGLGADSMAGMAGDDTYFVDDAGDMLIESAGEGSDTAYSSVSYDLSMQGNEVETLALTGTSSIDAKGNWSDNTLIGNTGDNVLDGSFGSDSMQGAGGNDTYIVSEFGDAVVEQANEGVDTVRSSVAFFTLGENVENLTLTGFAFDGTGNELSNILTGNDMNNRLDGAAGPDIMTGGLGDDTYVVDNAGVVAADLVVENVGEGIDTVESSVNYTLTANVERLTLTGAAVNGTGNDLDNTIKGTDGNNIIDGGVGADTMDGGMGDDIYVVDNVEDVIIDVGPGIDTVQTAMSYELGTMAALENLILTGSAAVNGTGNFIDNTLTGNGADNVLDGQNGSDTLIGGGGNDRLIGGFGSDTLIGGVGDDTYVVDQDIDVITELAGEGIDTVESAGGDYTLSANVENLTLIGTGFQRAVGNASDNLMVGTSDTNVLLGEDGHDVLEGRAGSDHLIGGSGNDLLNGGTESDMMWGGTGDDSYQVDDSSDIVTEFTGEGSDIINSSVSYALTSDAEVETIVLSGVNSINATGSNTDNTLIGNSGNNVLDGGFGNDTMQGGAGNDTYVVGESGDVVTEQVGEGTDIVQSGIFSYALGVNVENLTLTGFAVQGTGNTLDNMLVGNSVANVLDGGIGADSMAGGAGNDTYIVDNAADVVTENLNEGTDTVQASVSYTLGTDVENLTLTGAATNGTGNALNNVLIGNSDANLLNGGTGADSMSGGQGNDTYVVENAGDAVTELANEGTDTAQSSLTYTLGANVENLTLTGSSAINGTGNTLNNILTGNSAANVLTGGAGNDIYIVGVGDTVVEAAGGGTDTIETALTYTLGVNLENLTLTGSSAINGTGNSLNNVLTGNSAANVLTGGAGNDTYVVGTGDTISESNNNGTDTVQSSVTWTLGSNLEILTLTGAAVINGTGNSANNVLLGNSANNVLGGANGNDTLRGGLGNDTLNGGGGTDIFQFGRGEGQDLVQDNSGSADKLLYDSGINPLDLVISRQANDLRLSIHGSTDSVTVQNWYTSSSNRTETIQAGNGQTLLSTQVDQLIQAMAGFTQQTGLTWDQGIDQQPQDVQTVIAASWQ